MPMFTHLTCWFSNNEIIVVLILYMLYLPARASEQGNVIGLVSVYIYIYI